MHSKSNIKAVWGQSNIRILELLPLLTAEKTGAHLEKVESNLAS